SRDGRHAIARGRGNERQLARVRNGWRWQDERREIGHAHELGRWHADDFVARDGRRESRRLRAQRNVRGVRHVIGGAKLHARLHVFADGDRDAFRHVVDRDIGWYRCAGLERVGKDHGPPISGWPRCEKGRPRSPLSRDTRQDQARVRMRRRLTPAAISPAASSASEAGSGTVGGGWSPQSVVHPGTVGVDASVPNENATLLALKRPEYVKKKSTGPTSHGL